MGPPTSEFWMAARRVEGGSSFFRRGKYGPEKDRDLPKVAPQIGFGTKSMTRAPLLWTTL